MVSAVFHRSIQTAADARATPLVKDAAVAATEVAKPAAPALAITGAVL